METKHLGVELDNNFCDRFYQQLGHRISQIVYKSEEENTEKGAIIYEKNTKLVMGSVVTGTETEIGELTLQEGLGNPIGSFHTHPAEFFGEEESVYRKPSKKEIVFTTPDLMGSFLANAEFLCVVGDGFILHCLTGMRQARKNIKIGTLLDIIRERTEKLQRIYLEDIEKLGLTHCKRDIRKEVYKIAREAKNKHIKQGHLT